MGKIHCLSCAGSGQVLGNGMIIDDCKNCGGIGKVNAIDAPVSSDNTVSDTSAHNVIDRRSKAYKQSIKELLATDSSLTVTQAQELFEQAYKRQA